MIDIHAHILPGVDDGSRSLEESVEMVRELASYGVTDIIATPHYMNETIFMSPRMKNVELLLKLREQLAAQKINVNISLGNEIYIDKAIADLIDTGLISTMVDSKYILVELPINGEFPNYEDILQDLMDAGYQVILAHPERYGIVQQDYEIVRNLREMGILLQSNLGSVSGKYGKEAKRTVKKLIQDKMIFAFGSDMHRPGGEKYFELSQKKLAKYYDERELRKVLVTNPKKLFAEE